MEKELLAEALATLEKLTKHGLFFHSAIELSQYADDPADDSEMDGEEYYEEVINLIEKIKDALKRVV